MLLWELPRHAQKLRPLLLAQVLLLLLLLPGCCCSDGPGCRRYRSLFVGCSGAMLALVPPRTMTNLGENPGWNYACEPATLDIGVCVFVRMSWCGVGASKLVVWLTG